VESSYVIFVFSGSSAIDFMLWSINLTEIIEIKYLITKLNYSPYSLKITNRDIRIIGSCLLLYELYILLCEITGFYDE